MKRVLAAASLLSVPVVSACATAPTTAELAKTDPTAEECRRVKETGTNLPQRVCMTVQEWAAIDEQLREDAKSFRDNMDRSPGGRVPNSATPMSPTPAGAGG